MKVEHKTIKLKQKIKTPIARVYKALSSVKDKSKWSAPEGDAIEYVKSEFKIGGVEIFKCGSIGALDFKGIVHYEDIVKNERIVYTETVHYKKEKMASALITIELSEDEAITTIAMTIQVASYVGEKMLRGCEVGYKGSLRNLKDYLAK